jgi:hypothetical protein
MSSLRYEISLLILLALVAIIGQLFHTLYISRISQHVKKTTDESFSRNELVGALHTSQGSNFNTVMIFSWCLFLVAFGFLYFLTPTIFPEWNYFRFSQVASYSLGPAMFGAVIVLVFGFLVSVHVPRAYSSYLISNDLKKINLIAPLFLIGSILCSVYLGTIYPAVSSTYWNVGYAAIFLSLILLLLPIILGFFEEMRT